MRDSSCLVLLWLAFPWCVVSSASRQKPPRLVFSPVSTRSFPETKVSILTSVIDDRHNGYLAVSNAQWLVMAPNLECSSVETTSSQAKKHSCVVATNGGPFQSYIHGRCTGGVIINGHVASSDFSSTSVGFGLGQGKEGRDQWVFGGVASETEALHELRLKQFITSFGWLVYNGTSVVNDNYNSTRAKAAPRTAVGVDHEGRMMLVVVDGCEKCFHPKGPTLSQMSQLLVSLGALHAVNLDGGGSSTFVHNGRILDVPTCLDFVPIKCERPVATIMCLRHVSEEKLP